MPTYTERFTQITVMGDSWGQTETWQFGVKGIWLTGPTPTNVQLQALANALAAPTQALFSNTSVGIHNGARLLAIKCADVGTNGKYPGGSVPGIYTYPTPIVGPGDSSFAVPQATLAVTLLTNIPRGRGSRGRFFLPPFIKPIDGSGRLSTAVADGVEAAVKTWLNVIAPSEIVSNIAVMSGLGTGTTGHVNAIGVGRVIDTMRSRRRSLLEARTPLTL